MCINWGLLKLIFIDWSFQTSGTDCRRRKFGRLKIRKWLSPMLPHSASRKWYNIYVCVCVYMYIYICVYMYMCVDLLLYTHIYICIHTYIYICVLICIYMYMCVLIFYFEDQEMTSTNVATLREPKVVYIYMNVCVYIYLYIYINIYICVNF